MTTTATIERNFLTVPQMADRCGVSERTVLHWISNKQIHAEPLDPGRERTIWIISLDEANRIERERAKAKQA